MKVTCAYCQRHIRTDGLDSNISHGICHHCLPQALDEMQISIEDYLETIPVPALLVDDAGKPVIANRMYRNCIGTATDTAIDVSTKDECKSENGEYKGTDTVRMVVERARQSGVDQNQAHASAEITRPEGKRLLHMVIGTIRVGNRTIVKVDELEDAF